MNDHEIIEVLNTDGEIINVEVLKRVGVWVLHTRIDYPKEQRRPYVITHAPSGTAACAGARGQMNAIIRKLPQFGENWKLGKIDKAVVAKHSGAFNALVPVELRGTDIPAATEG